MIFRPIRHIAWCETEGQKEHGILLAASSPDLVTVSLQDGRRLSHWSSTSLATTDEEPPTKKRKNVQDGISNRPNIALMHMTNRRKHAIIATGEDKCIHVFEVNPDGQLEHLSRRCMPKRPSALAVTPDDDSILVADKFGDVYAIPLLLDVAHEAAFLAETDAKSQQKPYKPAATTLTVHSQRNLKALEQQLKQQSEPVKTKEPLRFSHQLLLGHVSVLTDVLAVRVPHGEKHRDYIITADRDEHIRVSRGVPQAHIIEGFCLGHSSFVSKLCMVKDVLVSGDGDGYLHVWDWVTGKLRKKIDIGQILTGRPGGDAAGSHHGRVAISGLWTYPSDEEAKILLVACEGHDTLWQISVEDLLSERDIDSRECGGCDLDGNILDLAVCGDKVFVARDAYHVARTMDEPREATEKITRLCVLQFHEGSGRLAKLGSNHDGAAHELLAQLEEAIGAESEEPGSGASLYGLHSLRKRGGEEASEDPT